MARFDCYYDYYYHGHKKRAVRVIRAQGLMRSTGTYKFASTWLPLCSPSSIQLRHVISDIHTDVRAAHPTGGWSTHVIRLNTEFIHVKPNSCKVKRGNSGHSLVLTHSLAHNFGNKIARARKL